MSYIGAEPTTAAFPFDQFSGDGTTTAFTLTYAPASTTSIIVAISGVVQNPNLYSVVGTTLTFSPAPPSGTSNIAVLYLGLPVITGSSPGNTAFLSSTDLTATASQTVFASAGSYTPGFVQVYRNGARLGNADFTATNGTTITLASAATSGDLVTIEYYTLTSLTNALPLTGGTVTGSTTFNSTVTVNGAAVSGFTGMKNRIINGNMVVDQRNAGAAVTPTNFTYNLDRWLATITQSSKFTVQQNAGSVTPPAGFTKYLGVTSSSAYSVGSSDRFGIMQVIEGLNAADLGWGTADAKTVTLSFWVRSSLTGTFSGTLRSYTGTDTSYPFTYTISTANTWELETITIAGPTTGTWATDNSGFVYMFFGLGTGSTFNGTAGAWATGNFWNVASSVSVVGTSGATWYVTGVQLERGSNATSFEFIDYGRQLAQCQRYFYRRTSTVAGGVISVLQAYSTTAAFGNIANLPVTMRATPTASVSAVGDFNLATSNSSNAAFTAINLDATTKDNIATGATSGSSGLVAGNATCFTSANSTGYINASAEL